MAAAASVTLGNYNLWRDGKKTGYRVIKGYNLIQLHIVKRRRLPISVVPGVVYIGGLPVLVAFVNRLLQELSLVADKFDPYREAQVVETETVWPEEFDYLDPAEKVRLEARLQSDPASCAALTYVRQHTGFARQIVVTAADLERVQVAAR